MGTSHDRKDPPIGGTAPPNETPAARQERKLRESELLDEAILETFPASDPVSPFVPAKGWREEELDVSHNPEEAQAGADLSGSVQSAPAGSEIENVGGSNPGGIESAGQAPAEQIDPGSDGKPVI